MTTRLMRRLRGDGSRLVLLCLAVNLSILAGIAVRNPDYLSDFTLNDSPDARHYVQLGRNLLLEGHYSRMEEPPYAPDLLRTPVYPVLAGALDIVTGPLGIYLMHVAAQLAVALLALKLAARCFGRRTGQWAGLIAAADLMMATYNFSALTEPLYTATTFLAVALLLPRLHPGEAASDRETDVARGTWLAGGTALAVATLIRPAGLYLPAALALAAVALLGRRRGWRPAASAAVLLLIPSVVLVGGWMLRNQRVFGVFRVSNVDAVGMVYMAGAGAYQVHHGIERAEAQRRIAAEFDLPTLLEVQNPWLSEAGPAELDARLRRATPAILARYPRALVLSSAGGLVKGSVSHNVPDLARLHRRAWTAPGLGELLRLRPAALGRLFSNHPALIGAFAWQVAHSLLVLALAAWGLWRVMRSGERRPLGLVLLLLIAYFGAGMALFGIDAYYRSRIPMLPYLYLFAGVGASSVLGSGSVAASGSREAAQSSSRR